ncbi:MAG: hypothetical protein ACREYC_04915 [Gammaproteobacteria bacterium]
MKNAGAKAVIHYAEDPKVSEKSPVLHELTFETDKTRLFFLAIDPSGSTRRVRLSAGPTALPSPINHGSAGRNAPSSLRSCRADGCATP